MSERWLRDLYGHQTWADAEHWRAIGVHQPAREDPAIRRRLHHIHFVQRVFLWAVGDRTQPFAQTRSDDFTSFEGLLQYARDYHDEARSLFDRLSGKQLESPVAMPWAPKDSQTITAAEALTQCAMHSHYHRGQNAARLRELGGEPPTTDLIVWYWKGRPTAEWAS